MVFKQSRLLSIMWLGLIQSIEDLRSKSSGFLEKKKFCLKTTASNPAQFFSLLFCPKNLRLCSFHNHVSQFLKVNNMRELILTLRFLWQWRRFPFKCFERFLVTTLEVKKIGNQIKIWEIVGSSLWEVSDRIKS